MPHDRHRRTPVRKKRREAECLPISGRPALRCRHATPHQNDAGAERLDADRPDASAAKVHSDRRGRVIDFVWWPSGTEWGHMQYVFPSGTPYSPTAISLSPYAFWIFFCLLAWLLSFKRSAWPFWAASTLYIWLFVVPLADIANTALPYILWDANNDFQRAFGPVRPMFTFLAIALAVSAVSAGFSMNRRLYRERAVGGRAYGILAVAAALLVLAVVSIRLG